MNDQAQVFRPPGAEPEGPVLTERDFKRIAAVLFEDSGIRLPPDGESLVHARLLRRLRALGLKSFRDYCDLVASEDGAPERQAMLSALTTNLTRFFREPHHFTDLGARFRQDWLDQARAGRRIRIWSAGCSSGEEAYSIALTLLSHLPDADRYDVRVLATDIDEKILRQGQAGLYSEDAVAPIPSEMRERWLERQPGGGFSMGAAARRLVSFRPLNLMGPWPMKGRFNAIFCRNVAIYFDAAGQDQLWSRYAPLLTADGRLYVGHSERVDDKQFKADGLTSYRLAGGQA